MKIYTEVNYTWDEEKNELVKESEKSFDYEGEVDQCGWFKPPKITPPKITPPKINLPSTSDINIPQLNPPDVPIPNIPAPGGSFEDLPGGMSLLTENVGSVASDVGEGVLGFLDRAAKFGKEALTGEGGYADDATKPRDLGPTGEEENDATLLTEGRKREVQMGTAYHSGSGSAGQV